MNGELIKNKTRSAVAIILALGLTLSLAGCSKGNKNSSETPKEPTTETFGPSLEPTETPVVVEEVGFTDIEDEEKLAERASEIVEYFNELAPNQNMTIEKVEEFLKYINGGVVNNPSYDGAAFVIDSINDLMIAELGAAADELNEVETGRKKKDILVDYSKFFLDETQGQKLMAEITALRQAMITHSSEDVSVYRKEFTELFMNSWILKGFDGQTINAYTLETPGMEAVIDLAFLNTSILVGEARDMVITNPLTMEEVTLKEIHDIANYEDCPTQLVDETGEVMDGLITLDKSSSDLYAMYTHALLNNRDLKENFGKTLN